MTQPPDNGSANDLVLDLNFVPAWARQPADRNPYAEFGGRSGPRRGREDQASPNRPRSPRAGPDRRRPPPGRAKDKERAPRNAAEPRPGRDPGRRDDPRAAFLDAAFIPERRGLQPLARLFAKTAQAYALIDVASMFLSRPEFHAVKLEALPDGSRPPPLTLYQCRECQLAFTDREQAVLHGFSSHFALFYDREETRGEPPKGQFTCVARCGLSRTLLGPPNYHAFNERLLELHRARFAYLPLEDYRQRVVNDTDPAAIEQWKEEACRVVTYRTRAPAGSAPLVFTRRADVEAHFREQAAPGLIREGRRCVVPGPASRRIEDPLLRQAIQRAWARENRFPLKIAIALQPAFRSYGLVLFKTPDKITFVTAIPPRPIDPAQTLDVIRRILEHLVAHPGSARSELAAALFPGADPNAPPVAECIGQLRWLIDKGHVIAFSNGKLAVPGRPAPAAPRHP